jgi:uncharacterized repeat protein (TIGR03803 family)
MLLGNYVCGDVFKVTPSGTFTSLYSFNHSGDGQIPVARLVQASDEDLFGTTLEGGANFNDPCGVFGCGTVFKITTKGTLTTLYSFCSQSSCADGSSPYAGLVQATNGDLYGTTSAGGGDGDGTVFKITPKGTLTTLYSFCSRSNCADGSSPYAGLIQATNGDLYGTASAGGANGDGTVFKITPKGTLTTLYSFCSQSNCADGSSPYSGLIQDTNGTFYGATYEGGANGGGTVFSLSVGLGPFVETNPTSGKVGAVVKILGTDLTGATSVTFNGTAAKFKVVSKSEVKTTVPEGATTGTVEVTTPNGTLKSNVVFRVRR